MDIVVIRYYNINRFLLSLTGMWPFQNQIVRQIQSFFVNAIFISSILVQIFKLITSEFSFELYINVSTYVTICIAYIWRYVTFIYQLQNIKYLIIRLCHNWDVLIDEKEYEIMNKYALKGKRFTLVCLILTCTLIATLVIWTTSLIVYDEFISLDDSHHAQPPFSAEYFVNEEVYFYYILAHMYIIFFIGIVVAVSVEVFFATCAIHACGLFYITGYRFEKALNKAILDRFLCTKRTFEMAKKVARAVEAHNNAIEFVDHMNSCFSTGYFVLLILAVAALTVNFTAIYQAIKADKVYDFLNNFARICSIMCYMFCASYCGQKLIDCSTSISEKVYDLPWILAPPKIRGLLLIVMQRSLKKCTMILGSLFPVSFEFFTLVLKLIICYVTSLNALQ